MGDRSKLGVLAAAGLVAVAVAAQLAFGATGDLQLPNLKATPARDVQFGSGTDLRFSTLSWNAGTGPLELVAGETVSTTSQNVYQRISLEGGGTTPKLAGQFVWHSGHNHFHFEGYALYTLQPADAGGASSRTGQKTTFCVMDTNHVSPGWPGSPSTAGYASCGNTVQGMSVGWGDRYGYTLSGQSIDMAGMADGDYRLFIDIDPNNHLSESDRSDNRSCTLLHISVTSRTVTVLNPNSCDPPPPAVTIGALTPASQRQGTPNQPVTITGTNLTSGMTVTFSNGGGPVPTATPIAASPDGTSATTYVTVGTKKGKFPRDNVWDVTIGGVRKADAYTITQQ